MKSTLIVSSLIAIMVLAVASTGVVQASPFYTRKTNFMILAKINPIDPNGKSNDCYKEIYVRATPKNNNHVLLNKEIIVNNNAPNNGPSRIYMLKWYIDISVFHQSDATNEGRIRDYAYLELSDGTNGATVTKYLPISQAKKVTLDGKVIYQLDFQTFNLVTNTALCA